MKNKFTVKQLVEQIKTFKGARFITMLYETKARLGQKGDLCLYTILVGSRYQELLLQSLQELKHIKGRSKIQKTALMLLCHSLMKSVSAHQQGKQNPDYTKRGIYKHLCKGVKVNTRDNTLELDGQVINRKVLSKGTRTFWEPLSPVLQWKYKFKKQLAINRYHSFALDIGHLLEVKINGQHLHLKTTTEQRLKINQLTNLDIQTVISI